ncbi:unnamed protein product [Ceutorhynchus assimilis]|uniref:Uncharacterized protein n=1 Tax=Ceutorhynchus assimilis TaxID=467358 RepID=A0A9N9MYJ8_9CUCU|nr:unnamed protein product [Ceutorhynchus assimilis]
MCPYCMCEVTQFPRHLERNHPEEGAVKEVLSLPNSNKKRKILLDSIRRQGNYVRHKSEDVIRPIRRPRDTEDNPDLKNGTYLPCDYCLGFFKRDYIRRHRKQCLLHNATDDRTQDSLHRINHLSKVQLFTICTGPYKDFYDSLQLKKEVFPIMRNDDISKAAMSGVLICSFGESQLKKHRRTQIKNVISNKLREMGRLLIELRKSCGAKQLIDILKPEYFDNFVAATKVLSGFDINTKTFRAGSLALHMGTNLKYICDTATKLIIKKSKLLPCENTEQCLKEVKRLKALIQQNWNTEISSIALKDLNEKNWQKPKLLPLTSDLMVFQKYVMDKAHGAFRNINNSENIDRNYRILAECVLALTLLLNRKRVGEIQYLKLSVYCSSENNESSSELLDSLSESEKILSKKFMRVVTGGKGSKPVPILFPSNIQNFIKSMLNVRDTYVPKSNEYLFANPKTENRWLSGYHVLRKLANGSGVSNKELITSTRLRKQIATVIQVLNINDAELEQFAKFMGHTKKTHEEFYRLPQDMYQTAKVSKILLAINKGKAAKYTGKRLDEIEFSDNVDSEDSDFEETEMNVALPRKTRRTAAITKDILIDSEDEEPQPSISNSSRYKTNQRNEKTQDKTTHKTAAKFKRKGLDDFELSDNTDCEDSEFEETEKNVALPRKTKRTATITKDILSDSDYEEPQPSTSSSLRYKKNKINEKTQDKITHTKGEKVRFTEDQKERIKIFFREHIRKKIPPKKNEVELFIQENKEKFHNKNWVKIKAFVYNLYKNK